MKPVERRDPRLTTERPDLDKWARAEKESVCTCGLIFAGYRASWATIHMPSCAVTQRYRQLLGIDP